MITKTKIDEICSALANAGENPATMTPKLAADTCAMARELEKSLLEVLEVAPLYADLIKLAESFIREHQQPGSEPFEGLDVVTTNAQGDIVPYDQVPRGSNPYMEILSLYCSLRRRESPIN